MSKYRCKNCFAIIHTASGGKCPSCGSIPAARQPEPLPDSEAPLPVPPPTKDAAVSPPGNLTPIQALEEMFRTLAMQMLGMCGQIEKISEVIEIIKKEQQDGRPANATKPQLPTEGAPRNAAGVAEPEGGRPSGEAVARDP